MPSRWLIPSENPPARLPATVAQPDQVDHFLHPLRAAGPGVCARNSRWLKAERPVCTARASSSAPTVRSGLASSR